MTVLEGLDDAISVTADTHDGLELLFANRTYRRVFGAQTGGHDELLAGRRGRFTDESVEVFAPSVQRWFEVHHRMLAWTDGRRVRMQVARDITERRVHEEASRVQQEKIQLTSRLTTMGEMASSLAHELNQPLTAIANYSMGAVALVKAGHQPQHAAAGAGEGRLAGRASRQDHQPHPRVRQTQRTAPPAGGDQPHRRQRHRVRRDRRAQAPHPHRALRALERARRAGRPHPDRTGAVEPAQEWPGGHGKSESDELKVAVIPHEQHIEVAVVDRGHGLPEPERLFEPFFSTKSQGLGMGLNICRTIIESHHGRLWADPNPAGGTIFRFTLPAPRPSRRHRTTSPRSCTHEHAPPVEHRIHS